MKVILEFDGQEDRNEIRRVIKATDAYLVLWNLDQWLRERIKFGGAGKEMEECREKLSELMGEQGVGFDELE